MDMKVNNYKKYLDGGTIEIDTDEGVYCLDYRIGSNTKGRLFRGYPKDDLSNLILNSDNITNDILEQLKDIK